MDNILIEKSILINATPEAVWQVFVRPEQTRPMGGEYVSDWKEGGDFGWKTNSGEQVTHGRILKIENAHVLKHVLFDPKDPGKILSTITYRFLKEEDQTCLMAVEEIHYEMGGQELADAAMGWDHALRAIKDITEKS